MFTTQYAAPDSSGFSVEILGGSSNIHLILTPTAGFAAETIVLPPVAECPDKMIVLVNCTQDITALTIDGNGATAVIGEPTAMVPNDFFSLKFDLTTTTWYRVG